MTAMIATGLITTSWTALSPSHIALIGLGAILVGFNEELLCRGILIIGARGVIKSEIWVCGVTAILFGLLHVPNGFFGLGPIGASIQVVFATCVGLGFYVLRSVSGSLFLPMLMHGAWDLASFTRKASDVVASSLSVLFQFATYFVALVAVTCLLRTHRNQNRTSSPL